jgi:hypothetical protein
MFHGRRANPCKIFADAFEREDSDDPGNYTELGGSDYDIDSNELLCVTGGLLICDTPHPGGASAPQRVRHRFKRTSTSEHARAVLAEQDANNYLYASVETVSGCDVLRLFKVIGGTTTELGTAQTIGDGAPLNVWHTLEACLSIKAGYYYYPGGADIFRAKVTLDGGKVYGNQAPSEDFVGGSKAGIDDSANVRCDDFYFGWMRDQDEPCKTVCPDCKTPCLIESDSFPGGTETTCKWDSSKLRVFHPERGTKHYAAATFTLSSGQNAEVRVNMKEDGSEYHWAKLALSGSTVTLTIGKNGSTLQTKTGTGAAGGYTLTVCYDGAVLTATGGPLTAARGSSVVEDGIYAGRAGSATFTSFQLQKHFASGDDDKCLNCPEPPADCSCCTDPQPVFSYIVDIGGPTLTNHCCSDCALIAGEYLVALRNPCDWFHIEGLCGGTSTCGGCACLGVTLRIEGVTNDFCKWQVDFNFSDDPGFGGSRCGCAPLHPNGFFARYESALFPRDQCGVMPRTLTKVSESFGPGPDLLCDGNMPSSATLRAAA